MSVMDPIDLMPLIEQLDDNIDDLEEALSPLLQGSLSDTAGKLPLLDKAQLYVLTTFAIESVLFCKAMFHLTFSFTDILAYLRLNEVNAKEHPVFRELARVKQYFAKITEAESGSIKRAASLDKPAAGRFIKHALVFSRHRVSPKVLPRLMSDPKAGNETYDRNRAQKQAGEKARTHIKFQQTSNKRKRDDVVPPTSDPNSQLVGATSSLSSRSPGASEATLFSKPNRASPVPDKPAEESSAESPSEQDRDETVEASNRKKKRKSISKKAKRDKRLNADNVRESGEEGYSCHAQCPHEHAD